MRILVISHLFPKIGKPTFGLFSGRHFVVMEQLGADVHVFVPVPWIPRFLWRFKSDWRNRERNMTFVQYGCLDVRAVQYLRLTRGTWSSRWAGLCIYLAMKGCALELHRQKPFDAVYGKGIFPSADAAVRIARLLGIPAIGEGIGDDVNTEPDYSATMHRHFVRVMNELDGAIADGKRVADRMSQASGKTVPIMLGPVDTDVFSPVPDKMSLRAQMSLPSEALIMLYVGALIEAKGIYEMLAAFRRARARQGNILLKICGTGPEHSRLSRMIEEQGMKDSVQLVGAVFPADGVAQWMQASDVLILASYGEGMPNVVMEAMACGLPVISTKVGGLPHAVGDCTGAILVEPKNVDELEVAMLKVAGDPALQRHMSIAARDKALQEFGAKKNVQMTLDVISETLNNRKRQV
jgi:teichuronic acid biosynthesis glycosyltransferase TuaC